ncbi:MAG: permease, partial [Firmicutes bacterium]|nr:permease [Bacillota bacterium]
MTKAIKFIKSNLFLTSVIFAYAVLALINPQIGLQGAKNSGYYIKEMLMIMPVIFVLTALLDSWVPKRTIIRYLGKEAKTKGVVLSFVLGSISAGPIYAAFPFCVMLHKKGASIKNVVIILSSWAVVKIPMLLNEAKFLGFKFMITRWILTVISILVFSWLTAKIVKDEDLPPEELRLKKGV